MASANKGAEQAEAAIGVGGMGLAEALAISVVERTREIRALSGAVMSLFVVEALGQTGLSWLVALPVLLAGAPLLADVLGFGASLLLALSASRVRVQQGLAYE